MEEARMTVDAAVMSSMERGIYDWGKIKNITKDALGEYVWKKTKRRPMIVPIIMEV
jgi:ribonuclease J